MANVHKYRGFFFLKIPLIDLRMILQVEMDRKTDWLIRVGWWISEYFACCAKWKLLGIETAVVKRFCSKIPILEDNF